MLYGSGGSLARAASFDDGGGSSPSAKAGDGADKDSAHPPTDSSTDNAKPARSTAAEADKYNALDEKVRKLEDIVKQQQMVIDSLQNRLSGKAGEPLSAIVAPAAGESAKATAASSTAGQPANASGASPAPAIGKAAQGKKPEESPLQFRIGTATVVPVGFMDFTSVIRSTNTGNGIGTNFGSIPVSTPTTVQSHLTENRFSIQNSRIGARVDADVKGAHVIGYWE